jgi:hypothetical protein
MLQSSGTHAITASYSGDANFADAQDSLTQNVWNVWTSEL